jgi:hypothetical protein
MINIPPPPTVRIHWIYEDPAGDPTSAVRKPVL